MTLLALPISHHVGRKRIFPKFHQKTGWVPLEDLAVLQLCPGILARNMLSVGIKLQLSVPKRGSAPAQLKIFLGKLETVCRSNFFVQMYTQFC